MCIISSPKPKVEQVAPSPTAVQTEESAAVNDRIKADNKKRRAMVGADQMRSVLTDTAQGKQTLG